MSRVLSKQTREAACSTHRRARTPSHWVMRPVPACCLFLPWLMSSSLIRLHERIFIHVSQTDGMAPFTGKKKGEGGHSLKWESPPSQPSCLGVAQPGRCFVSLHGGWHSFLYQRWTGLFFLDEVSDWLLGMCGGPFSFVPVSGSIHLTASLLFLSVQ